MHLKFAHQMFRSIQTRQNTYSSRTINKKIKQNHQKFQCISNTLTTKLKSPYINWQILLDVDTVDQKWKIFKTTIHQLVSEYVPFKKTYKKKKSSWIQNATVKMMKTRNTEWKKYNTYLSERNFQEYKRTY